MSVLEWVFWLWPYWLFSTVLACWIGREVRMYRRGRRAIERRSSPRPRVELSRSGWPPDFVWPPGSPEGSTGAAGPFREPAADHVGDREGRAGEAT